MKVLFRRIALACSLVTASLLGASIDALAQSTPTLELREMTALTVVGTLGTRGSGVAENVSGVACAPPRANGDRTCLVVDDEAGFVQRATLEGKTLRVGERIQILTAVADTTIIGSPPNDLRCPRTSNAFRELDGEGIAFAPSATAGVGSFYVIGSHGCSRQGEARLSQFLFTRISYQAATDTFGPPERTWRLSEGLRAARLIGSNFGIALDTTHGGGGIDIEGIAVDHDRDRLMVGLRAPVLNGESFILPIPLAILFTRDGSIRPDLEIKVSLGNEVGIRDMSTLPDGRLLLLSGPAPNRGDIGPALYALNLTGSQPSLTWLANLPPADNPDVKYEGVTWLSSNDQLLTFLIVHDGQPNGNPTRMSFHTR